MIPLEWAAQKGMNSFLSVTHGTNEPAKFLEMCVIRVRFIQYPNVHCSHYRGAADKKAAPLAFVGKGITFDSGGISIKPSADMKLMRGDMGGAATVCAAALAIAKLKLPYVRPILPPRFVQFTRIYAGLTSRL